MKILINILTILSHSLRILNIQIHTTVRSIAFLTSWLMRNSMLLNTVFWLKLVSKVLVRITILFRLVFEAATTKIKIMHQIEIQVLQDLQPSNLNHLRHREIYNQMPKSAVMSVPVWSILVDLFDLGLPACEAASILFLIIKKV